MDTVIILKGAGQRGKTQTLKLLVNDFITNQGATIVHDEGYVNDNATDCFIVLDLPGYGRVGVITYGDPNCEPAVIDALEKCLKYECKAVIGASRTKESSTHDTVYTILWKFGSDHDAKTVEATTYVTFPDWGKPQNTRHLNEICAKNIETLLRLI